MTKKKGSTKKRARSSPTNAERYAADLAAFPHHMSEVLRIAQTWDTFPHSFYNDLGEAWNDFVNDTQSLADIYHDETFIRLILSAHTEEGGAR